jgi:hypothetical protein
VSGVLDHSLFKSRLQERAAAMQTIAQPVNGPTASHWDFMSVIVSTIPGLSS